MRFINREFYRFIFWGGVNTLSGYLLYTMLLKFLPYLISYSITYIVIVSASYFLTSKFVFKQEPNLSKGIQYPLVYVTQYLLGTISLYFLVEVLRLNKLLAPALVVAFTIPVTFLLSRRIIKGKQQNS